METAIAGLATRNLPNRQNAGADRETISLIVRAFQTVERSLRVPTVILTPPVCRELKKLDVRVVGTDDPGVSVVTMDPVPVQSDSEEEESTSQ